MSPSRSIEQILEQQVRAWEVRHAAGRRGDAMQTPTICVSREAGSGGERVAREVATRLNLCYFDREIVEEVAKDARLSERVVASLDERKRMDLDNWFNLLVSSRHITPDQYAEHLIRVVGAIGEHGNSVILGRGAGFILSPDRCLRVRCVAPLELRARRFAEENLIPVEDARRRVAQSDRDRADFIRNAFGADCEDARNYDLIANTQTFSAPLVVEVVYQALRELVRDVDLDGNRRRRGHPAAVA